MTKSISTPTTFQREIEDGIPESGSREKAGGGQLEVWRGDVSAKLTPEMAARVDDLKAKMRPLSPEARKAMIEQIKVTDPQLYRAVLSKLKIRGNEIDENISRIRQLNNASSKVENVLGDALLATAKKTGGKIDAVLKLKKTA